MPQGSKIYLEYQAVLANAGQAGATQRRDAIRNSKKITILSKDGNSYLMNANAQLQKFRSYSRKLLRSNLSGLSVAGAGSLLYDDYNDPSRMTREQTKNLLCTLLDEAGRSGELMVSAPNAYALSNADWLSGLPQESSGYHLLGEEVPFYYLIVNGKIPYSMDVAGIFPFTIR